MTIYPAVPILGKKCSTAEIQPVCLLFFKVFFVYLLLRSKHMIVWGNYSENYPKMIILKKHDAIYIVFTICFTFT